MSVCRNYEKGTIIKIRCKSFMVCTRAYSVVWKLLQSSTPSNIFEPSRCPDSWCPLQTYKEATFRPSPRLNLILAPNGQLRQFTDCLQSMAAAVWATLRIQPDFQNALCYDAGAGKSSLTCAMALGLAADPKVTLYTSIAKMQHALF